MNNWLLGLILPKKVGEIVGKIQLFLDGKKTYLAGAIVILQAVMMLIEQFIGMSGLADIFSWLKGIASNPAILQIGAGLGMIGLGHKLDKTTETK